MSAQITRQLRQGELTESHVHPRDYVNSKGVSLFDTYRVLWNAVNEYDMKITVDTTTVANTFRRFIYFPFEEVARVMSDHVRKLLRFQLRFLFLPYTKRQAVAINRLKTQYPKTEQDKLALNAIFEDCDKLDGFYTQSLISLSSADRMVLEKTVTSLNEKVFELNQKQLWIVLPRVTHTLSSTAKYLNESKTEVTLGYLDKYKKEYGYEILAFEDQLIEDITQLSSLNLIHPDVYLALEEALHLLELYYTPIAASKLFIDNVEYKIKRYLAKAREELGIGLIEEFRHPQQLIENQSEEKLTVEKQYKEFLILFNEYQTTGKGLYRLLEATAELKKLPYDEIEHLAGFAQKIAIVESINPFSTLDKY